MDEKGLGRRLQEARLKAGLTQQSLCQKANLSYSTLAKIERGAIKSPSIFTIQSIASALGVSMDQLLGEAQAPSKPKLQSQTGVRFVYFDINGCLVHFFHSAFTKLAEVTGAPADVIETTFWHYNDDVCRGNMDISTFNQKLTTALGASQTINWPEYYFEAISPIKEMDELVHWAAERYYIGLLTNIMPGFIHIMRDRGMLPAVDYDVIIDSSEVGFIKPEKQVYELAAQRSGCAPEEILLVDDSRVNLMAAEKFGWHVLWFNDYEAAESAERVYSALQLPE